MAIDMPDNMRPPKGINAAAWQFIDLVNESHNIVTASDLYAYHVLPSITADLEAMGVTLDQEYHADCHAETRWKFLDAQQKKYWKKRVKEYRAGFLQPLERSTYEYFCAERHSMQDDDCSDADDSTRTLDGSSTPFKFLRTITKAQVTSDFESAQKVTSKSRGEPPMEKARLHPTRSPVSRPTFNASAVAKLEAALQEAGPKAPTNNPARSTSTVKKVRTPGAPVVTAPPAKNNTKKVNALRVRGVQYSKHDDAIVHLLGGPAMHLQCPDYTTGISTILCDIAKRMQKDTTLTLRGRYHGVRINFDPRASDVTSIRARLLAAEANGETIDPGQRKLWNPKAKMGFVLRFLVDWNRNSRAFQDCTSTGIKPKTAHRCMNEYTSRWTWLECLAGVIGPVTYARRDVVICTIMQLLRERAKQLVG